MKDIAGATIGKIGSGLNQEQRKRLTIGVELASKPELLMFLDEPTSGLDSGAAFNIVRFLTKLSAAGQAILCTIHQPSSVLFEHFDELLLLKSGGKVVYHGPLGHDSRTMIDYLKLTEPRNANTMPTQLSTCLKPKAQATQTTGVKTGPKCGQIRVSTKNEATKLPK